jgi:hypothetical protein
MRLHFESESNVALRLSCRYAMIYKVVSRRARQCTIEAGALDA